MNSKIYEDGKNCAIRGGSYLENPFMDKYDEQNRGITWLRGFKDYKIPDPHCSRCNGTGKLPTDAGKYGLIEFDCLCNSSSEKR